MKEFKKWKKKNCEDGNCPHEASCNGCENMWRAALGMVLGWLDYSSEHKEIADKIHDELEGGGE